MTVSLTYGSVCSGIEAASVAWHPLGWRPAFFSEIDAAPRAVLAHHYPGVPLHGDFTTIQAGQYADIDLLVGGTPCQSFSVAGLRGGLDDDRGNLALEFLRLADRLRPRWIVWENVPGVLSSLSHTAPDPSPPPPPLDLGCDGAEVETEDEYGAEELHAFNCFLAGLSELGYGFAYRVLDAQYVRVDGFARAVPQRRRRVFVVGYIGDWRRPAAVLFEREGQSGNPAPGRQAGEAVAPTISARPTGGGGLGTDFDLDGGLIAGCLNGLGEYGAEVPTLRAKGGDAAGGSEALLAFGGNNTSGLVDVATDGTGRGTPIVPVFVPDHAATLTRGAESSGKNGYAGRRQEDDVNLIAFDTTQITSATNRCQPESGDPCHPLAAGAHPFAIAFDARQSDVCVYGEKAGPLDTDERTLGILQGWVVRRLIPTECERLQGFEDGYTLVPFRKGMMADGPRYKMLGNSMPVPVMRWIGHRIATVETLVPATRPLARMEQRDVR